MRQIIFSAMALILLVSCGNEKKNDQSLLPDSSGNMSHVSVVLGNDLWDGGVGETIRNILGTPIYGLPQDEPMFSVSQIPASVFSGFVTKNRTILKIAPNKEAGIEITDNVYAKPQKVITVSGKTREEIISTLNENADKIIETFRNTELSERMRQMSKSHHTYTAIEEKLGLTIDFPSVYIIAKESDNFFWVRKEITTGTNNLMIYSLPYDAIKRNDSVVNQIIKVRDSVGKLYIRGRQDGDLTASGDKIESYMVTENAYTPFYGETIVDNKPALETKGLWDLKGDFMGGPFISYVIEDEINKRWVVVEGFAFAPSVEKRNYMLELEAIIRSVKIK
ncbi:DUF4837 family protein [Algibacter sp. L4_22]|uniref:DUF4837 family protein n=1 Tax=Algibacter sp. L4_22 TaxID=2942477 RepID=UPI00201B7F69|nr:DUF4837 family protein [Algibacter sp. L4_22]MCL5127237.1 DUF4837 family protein [Algibacter sp. L4_22]